MSEISKLLYNKALKYCENSYQEESGKHIFISTLNRFINDLIDENAFEEVFKHFEKAQNIFGEDPDVLNVLAVALNRLGKPIEALNYLNKALEKCPLRVKLIENRENIINQWVPRWHFIMLNDTYRNKLYNAAIINKVKEGCKRVLDIGTGTGLLSIYCHNAGAKSVYACEVDEIMCEIATNVFEDNQIPVTLIPQHSTTIMLKDLRISGFDLIVTEIFDCGAFGEDVLNTLIHAKKHLLKTNGHIIPETLTLFVVGVDNIQVREKQESLQSAMENSIYLKNTILIPKSDGPYEAIEKVSNQMVMATQPVKAFTVDFNDVNSLEKALRGELDKIVTLISDIDGHLEGFLVYFELKIDNTNILRNFDPTNNGSTLFDMNKTCTSICWDPVIFPLNYFKPLNKYEHLKVNITCKNGVLNVVHDYDIKNIRSIEIDPHVFSFLADDEFIYELEFNVGEVLKKYKRNFKQMADFLPFPHIGINFLKEKKVSKLYCLAELRDLITNIASWNCIPETAIEFVDDIETLVEAAIKFDLILLNPLTSYGGLNEKHLKYYGSLKSICLSPNGTIFPFKVDLCCKLIHSPWLDRVTLVRNQELEIFGIQKYMNQYSTKHQFECLLFDASDLSDVVTMASVQFTDKLYEKQINVNLNSSQLVVNGILYFYKIFFMSNSIPILTNRKKSICKANCFVQTVNVEGKSSLVVKFIQDEFSFRCLIK